MAASSHGEAPQPGALASGDGGAPPNVLERLFTLLACALVLALTAITLLDVLGRDLFNKPLSGATELTELLLLGMTFLFYPRIAWSGSHITVDLFDWFRAPLLRTIQRVVCSLMGALAFGGLAWQLGFNGVRAEGYGDITPSLGLHLSWALWFMALMAAITCFAFVLRMFIAPPAGPPQPEPL